MSRDEQRKLFTDPQTGQLWQLEDERWPDIVLASISAIYLMITLILFLWLLVDAWFEKYTLVRLLGDLPAERLCSPFFQLGVYSFVGGGLGAIANGIRSILQWHCDLRAFGRRFVWKYILLPWLGGTLGLFVFALILGGIAVVAGDINGDDVSEKQIVAIFAVGALAGFGSRNVFKWLDVQVLKLFKTVTTETVTTESVPNLIGMTKDKAGDVVSASDLILGNVIEKPDQDETKGGTVIDQAPPPGARVARGTSVHITIGTKATET